MRGYFYVPIIIEEPVSRLDMDYDRTMVLDGIFLEDGRAAVYLEYEQQEAQWESISLDTFMKVKPPQEKGRDKLEIIMLAIAAMYEEMLENQAAILERADRILKLQ